MYSNSVWINLIYWNEVLKTFKLWDGGMIAELFYFLQQQRKKIKNKKQEILTGHLHTRLEGWQHSSFPTWSHQYRGPYLHVPRTGAYNIPANTSKDPSVWLILSLSTKKKHYCTNHNFLLVHLLATSSLTPISHFKLTWQSQDSDLQAMRWPLKTCTERRKQKLTDVRN